MAESATDCAASPAGLAAGRASGPREPLSASYELLSPRWQSRLIRAFLVLGVLARFVRYALRFPLWEDECFLCLNLPDRSFAGLLQPLDCHQIAPMLFLWLQKSVIELLGFSEMTLRLVPFVASVAALLLFVTIARRLVAGTALVVAVAFLAVAYPGIRYAAEAKPYGMDLLVAAALLAMVLAWRRRPDRTGWLWAAAVTAPVAVGVSYPAVFVAGGLIVLVGLSVWRGGARKAWPAWSALTLLTAGGCVAVYLLAVRHQSQAELRYMQTSWGGAFPPSLTEPVRWAWWMLRMHAGPVLAYPVGGERGASTVTLVLCVIGLGLALWRRRWWLVGLATIIPALHLAAAAMRRYPYGEHVKFSQHMAPMICVLAGLGVAALSPLWTRRPVWGRRALAATLVLLACIGVGSIVRDTVYPYKTLSDLRARAFARWFWFNAEFHGEAVCAHTDLGLPVTPSLRTELTWGAMYLCNQRIYSPRHRRGLAPNWQKVAADWPLRVVVYRVGGCRFDQARLDEWLAEMKKTYRLTGRSRYPFPRYAKRERRLLTVDTVEILTFVPRRQPTTRPGPSPGA